MIGLLTSRAEIEIIGKKTEREDIIPVDYDSSGKECFFTIKKSEFIYKLIMQSQVFAVSSPKVSDINEKQIAILEASEGEFIDKFDAANLRRTEAMTIDCPVIKDADVFECRLSKTEDEGDRAKIFGEILVSRRA